MNNTIQYKGYIGSIEFSEEDRLFYGKVMGIRSLISYEGKSAAELIDDFHNAVDDYLEMCAAEAKNLKLHIKAVSISEFLRSFTDVSLFMPQPTISP